MNPVTPIQRQWQILIALMARRQGQTITELSKEVGVTERTIRRDLVTLRRHFPLEERTTKHGCKHWRLVDGATSAPIHFNWSEAVALYLGRRLLDPLAGTNFWHAAQTAFGKIKAMLGETALKQIDKVAHSFLQTEPGVANYADKADLIESLMIAIEEHRIAFVTYQSERATEPVSLEMYPYGIVYHKGSLYLVAYSRDHEQPTKPRTPTSPAEVACGPLPYRSVNTRTNRKRSQEANPPDELAQAMTPAAASEATSTTLGQTPVNHLDRGGGSSDQSSVPSAEKRGSVPSSSQNAQANSTWEGEAPPEPLLSKTHRDPSTEKRGLAPSSDQNVQANPTASGACPPFSVHRDPSAIRIFKIDRVTGVDVQNLQFTPDPNFDLKQHFANSFGVFKGSDSSSTGESTSKPKRIRIRFHQQAARYVQEKRWHASQEIQKEPDGCVVLSVHLENFQEIKSWILSFGPRATVLEPEELKHEICADLSKMLGLYESKPVQHNVPPRRQPSTRSKERK